MWTVVMNFIVPILKKYWLQVLVFAILTGAVWYVQGLRHTITEQKTTISSLTETNKTLKDEKDQIQTNYEGLKTGLENQGKMLANLAGLGDQMTNSFNDLRFQLSKDIGTMGTSLGRTLNQNMSKLTCEQAIDYLRNRAIEETKK